MALLESEARHSLFAEPSRHPVEELRDALAAISTIRDAVQEIGLAVSQRLGAHGVERGGIEAQSRIEPAFKRRQPLPEDAVDMLRLAARPRHADAHLGLAVLRVEEHQGKAARALAVGFELFGDAVDQDARRLLQALHGGERIGEFDGARHRPAPASAARALPLPPERLIETAGDRLAQPRPEAGARDVKDLADGLQAQPVRERGAVRVDPQGLHRQSRRDGGLLPQAER